MQQINLAETVCTILRDINRDHASIRTLHYKVCITTPTLHLLSSDRKRHAIQWIKAKFGGFEKAIPALAGSTTVEELQRTKAVIGEGAHKWDCWAVTRHVPGLNDRLSNDEARCSKGVNAVVFQFDLYEPDVDQQYVSLYALASRLKLIVLPQVLFQRRTITFRPFCK